MLRFLHGLLYNLNIQQTYFERMIEMKKNMRFVKYIVTMILAVALVVGMAACGTSAPVESGVTTAPTTETTAPTTAATKATQPVKEDPKNPAKATEPAATTAPATAPTEPKQTASAGQPQGGNSGNAGGGSASTPAPAQPVHSHSYSVANTVGATCTIGGYTTYKCSCGATYNDNYTSASGHSWGEWVTTSEATYDAEGQQTRTCGTCGATESQSIPKLEAPAVSLDYGAAGSYGDSYAASTYGCIVDYSLNSDNAGYHFASFRSVDYYINNGGQSALNADMAAQVDVTAYDVGSGFYVNCSAYENGGYVYFVVYYG